MFEDILFGVTVFLVVWLIRKTKSSEVNKLNTPPGPKPMVVLGNILLYLRMNTIQASITLAANFLKDTGIIAVKLLGIGRVYLLSSPKYAEVLLSNKVCYEKSDIFYPKLTSLFDGLITLSGEPWKKHRKQLSPCFSTRKLQNFCQIFSKVSYQLSDHLHKFADGQSFQCAKVFSPYLFRSVVANLCDIDKLPFSDEYLEDFFQQVNRETTHSSNILLGLYTDAIRRVLYYNWTARRFKDKATDMVYKLTEELTRLRQQTDLREDSEKNYLDRAAELPKEDYIAEMNTGIVAGYETTVITTTYVCLMLALHPEWQDILYQEQVEIFGGSRREIVAEDLARMKQLDACVNETLRLYPTVPIVGRQLTTDIPFGEYTAYKDTHIFLILVLLHRDPDSFEKPEEFYPQHFSPENVKKRNPYAFIPFGAGGRQCLGNRYAMLSIKSTLSNIIRHYTIQTDMKMSELETNRVVLLDATQHTLKLTPRSTADCS